MNADAEALTMLPREDLVAAWHDVIGRHPPKGISQRLMIRAVAHAKQERAYGGLPDGVARRLERLMAGEPVERPQAAGPLSAGTRLIREWNGVTHTVDVVPDGFIWNGEQYRSISAIARAITGARWSGPRFFGLK